MSYNPIPTLKNNEALFSNNVGIGVADAIAKLDISDVTLAGSGSLSGSALNIAQTWNTSGTPTAIKLNVTDTTSNASSLLMDLQVGGASRFRVIKNDDVVIGRGGTAVIINGNNESSRNISNGSARLRLRGSEAVSVTPALEIGINYDVSLTRDASGILAQRNSTNAQEFRLYNTYTNASNYERLSFKANTGGAYTIASEAAGTGTQRAIQFNAPIVEISGTMIAGVDGANSCGITLTNTNGLSYRVSSGVGGVANSCFAISRVGNNPSLYINGNASLGSLDNVGIGATTTPAKLTIVDTVNASSGALSGSALNIAQTWNTTGAPTAIKLDVTDTASNANSLLMDLQVGGSSRLQVSKSRLILHGNGGSGVTGVQFQPIASAGSSTDRLQINFGSNAFLLMDARGGVNAAVRITGGSRRLSNISALSFTDDNTVGTQNTTIWEEANQTLGMRASTNPQEFRLYNTYTDASNYERLSFKANTGGAYTITSEAAGTGSGRPIQIYGQGIKDIEFGYNYVYSVSLSPFGMNSDLGQNVSRRWKMGYFQTLNLVDTALAGSAALSGSALDIAQTWNTTGTPTAIKLDVTDTASNASSLLMDLQVGGSSKFKVDKSGKLIIENVREIGVSVWLDGGAFYFNKSIFSANRVLAGQVFTLGTSLDVNLVRDAANTLAQRNSASSQEFRLYNTYTNASNYERLSFKANTGGAYTITSEAAGTGSVRDIALMGGNVGIGTTTPVSKLSVSAGDIEAETIGNGVILKSPNGTRYRITVDDTGALITTALP